MGLETATYISDLNPNNPVGATDPKSQGDDHLRLIKETLQNTFPNVEGAVTPSHTELNYLDGATGVTGTGHTVRSIAPVLTGNAQAENLALTNMTAALVDADAVIANEIAVETGSAADPSIQGVTDPNTGIFIPGSDVVSISNDGTLRYSFTTQGLMSNQDGTASAPVFSRLGDANTGTWFPGADRVGISTGGTNRLEVNNASVQASVPFYGADGTASAPAYSFGAVSTLGFYRTSGTAIRLANNGTDGVQLSTIGTHVVGGSSSVPSMSFLVDTNTGFYRHADDTVGVTHGGLSGVVGFRDAHKATFSGGSGSTQVAHAGKVLQFQGSTTTLTIDISNAAADGQMTTIINSGSGNMTLTPSAGTLYWFNGSGALSTGNRTLAVGGVAVILINQGIDAYIWGVGIS